MEMKDYIAEIKLELTGNLLNLELPDDTLEQVVRKAFREVHRYLDTTQLMTIPFASCIDLTDTPVSSVSRIYRTNGYSNNSDPSDGISNVDPMQVMQWQCLNGGGNIYQLSDWLTNYGTMSLMQQIRNTTSTDLSFREDHQNNKLYINCLDKPSYITIEYVPKFSDVSQIKSDYWIDVIVRLSIALTKITLGRIRSRYTQSNSLWTQDGDKLLEEGNNELTSLRETLRVNSQVIYPID